MKKLTLTMLLGIVLTSINAQQIEWEGKTFPIIDNEQVVTTIQEVLVFKYWPSAIRIQLRLKRAGLLRSMTPVKVGLRHEYHIELKEGDLFRAMPNTKYLAVPIRIQLNNVR